VEKVLEAYPPAAYRRNSNTGRTALFEAIAAGHQWSSAEAAGVLELLFRAAPEVVEWRDRTTGLPPALLAAQTPQKGPAIHGVHAIEPITAADLDPFNLLMTKQHDLIQQQKRNAISHGDSILPKSIVSADTSQLDTLFELLRANPTQILLSS